MGDIMQSRHTILVNHLLEPRGRITGITRYLFSLLSEMVRRDAFHYVLATTWTVAELPSSLRTDQLEVETFPFVQSHPLNIANQTALLGRLMRRYHASGEFNCNPIGCFLPLWPRVIVVHDLYMKEFPACYPSRHRLWWNIFFPLCAKASKEIICVSENTKATAGSYYPGLEEKCTVVHEAGALSAHSGDGQGIDGELEPNYGLFVGNITPNKNVELLIAAMRIAEARGTPLTIYHVGRDDCELLARAMSTGMLTRPVRSLGCLSDRDLDLAYRGARFFVTTSKQEGFCLPVVEAQTRGIPVVCPDLRIFREIAGTGALFFSPDSPQELSDCFRKLNSDTSAHKMLSERALDNSQRFSWGQAAAATEAILLRTVTRN